MAAQQKFIAAATVETVRNAGLDISNAKYCGQDTVASGLLMDNH
jgi:hypothetical protein